jgi:caspase domain-containing protein
MRLRWLLALLGVVLLLSGCDYTIPIPTDVTFNNPAPRWSWTGTWQVGDVGSWAFVQNGEDLSGAGPTPQIIGKVAGNVGTGSIDGMPFTFIMSDDGMYLKGEMQISGGDTVNNLKRVSPPIALVPDEVLPAAAVVPPSAPPATRPQRPAVSPGQRPSPGAAVALPPSSHRRALLIGNAAYPDSPLSNPVHDATDLASLLRRLGFEVTLQRDADRPTMEQAIDRFTQGVPRGSAGLFFFAGHGVQIEGVNYLIPIGTRFMAASDVKYQAVAADWVLARMDESGMDVKLLLLDACRNNPLGRSWTRALSRGLAVMETPQGALLAYATSPGKTAGDGAGRNSPFTVQLLRELALPGRDIEVALKAVRAGVQQSTKGEQIPWVASSMTGDFAIAR